MKRRPPLTPHPAHWPPAARLALLLAAALTCTAAGLFLYVQERSALRQAAENLHRNLQSRLISAWANAAELPALRARENLLNVQLLNAREQLWPEENRADSGLLQLKLARRAEECGLEMESFKPLAAAHAEISIGGAYADLLRFVELVTQPPLPLQVASMELAIHTTREGKQALLMKAVLGAAPHDTDTHTKK